MSPPAITFRPATPFDAPRIAALHARSWREHYTNAMSAAYLEGEASVERLALWTDRFTDTPDTMRVVLAEAGTDLVGFSCLFFDHDATDGTLLDNLHVRADYQGHGVGKRLLHEVAGAILRHDPAGKLYLWVLESNTSALAFYQRLGGTPGRRVQRHLPGTGEAGVTAIAVHFDPPTLRDRSQGST